MFVFNFVQVKGKTTTRGWGDYSDPLQINFGDNNLGKYSIDNFTKLDPPHTHTFFCGLNGCKC